MTKLAVPSISSREDLEALMKSSPFNRLLGMRLGEVSEGGDSIELIMPYTDANQRSDHSGQVHGGAISALIDSAGTYAVVWATKQGVPTVDLRIDYLRPAGTGDLIARARARKTGRRLGFADVEVVEAAGGPERLVAIGRGVFSIG